MYCLVSKKKRSFIQLSTSKETLNVHQFNDNGYRENVRRGVGLGCGKVKVDEPAKQKKNKREKELGE